ncbi:hypothetical protein FisN_13Lh242 [Fistulifera solaris]|uniref:Cyclin N-terminal domain-containing protein n=1 Tax=Fistulifera solaris TaxID=1519565 RepID=A0A1Z5KM52_FISSO|nr:hypothetical protein FisN_13Lh242 [Fistulifera solaris]|eukprot:GAX27205.1 hypothetical protein FisN_13Lh242 [Fistulifera solaris]
MNHQFQTAEVDDGLRRDQLEAMMSIEPSYVVPHIPCSSIAKYGSVPLESWRRKICQWAFRVIDHFRLDREVVTTGMNLFDRFLLYHEQTDRQEEASHVADCRCPCCKRNSDPTTYQLAAMTSIFISVKLASLQNNPEENAPHTHFRLSTFADLSRGQFTMNEIYIMERTIYQTVGWKVMLPSPITFVSHLLTLMPKYDDFTFTKTPKHGLVLHVLHEISRYLTEIATCLGSSCSHHRPSQVAFAAILVSMDLLTYEALPLSIRDTFRHRVDQVCGIRSVDSLVFLLERALWPEMLLDHAHDLPADVGHPIAVARNHGILDLNRIYYPRDTSNPMGPTLEKTESIELFTHHPETSPVSTAR